MADRQPCHERETHAQSIRSTGVKQRREGRDRFTTANWCRSARISRCRAARERTNNRSEWRNETTTDTMDRAYSEQLTTSIVTRRTAFLAGTGHACRLSESARNLNRRNTFEVLGSHTPTSLRHCAYRSSNAGHGPGRHLGQGQAILPTNFRDTTLRRSVKTQRHRCGLRNRRIAL